MRLANPITVTGLNVKVTRQRDSLPGKCRMGETPGTAVCDNIVTRHFY